MKLRTEGEYTIQEYEDGSTYKVLTSTLIPAITEREPDALESVETLEQKIERLEKQIQEDNLVQFEVLATIYEQLMAGGN